LAGTTRLLPRCSRWWSLSRMSYCKSTTQPRHLQPGSSTSQDDYLWNSRWCFASARWDQPRRSSQAKTARWHSRNWQGDSGDQSIAAASRFFSIARGLPLKLHNFLLLSASPAVKGRIEGVASRTAKKKTYKQTKLRKPNKQNKQTNKQTDKQTASFQPAAHCQLPTARCPCFSSF